MMLDLHALSDFPAHVALDEDTSRLDISNDGITLLGRVRAEIDIIRSDQVYYCTGQALCEVQLECSRCLKSYNDRLCGAIEFSIQKVADIGQFTRDEVPENELIIAADAGEVEITGPVREALLLAVPMKPLCREDCLGICPTCGVDRNKTRCDCVVEKTDSRWNGLQDLFNK